MSNFEVQAHKSSKAGQLKNADIVDGTWYYHLVQPYGNSKLVFIVQRFIHWHTCYYQTHL